MGQAACRGQGERTPSALIKLVVDGPAGNAFAKRASNGISALSPHTGRSSGPHVEGVRGKASRGHSHGCCGHPAQTHRWR